MNLLLFLIEVFFIVITQCRKVESNSILIEDLLHHLNKLLILLGIGTGSLKKFEMNISGINGFEIQGTQQVLRDLPITPGLNAMTFAVLSFHSTCS